MFNFLIKQRPKPQQRHRNHGKFHYDPSSKEKKDFRIQAKEYAPKKPLTHKFDVHLTFCYKRPKSHYRSVNKEPVLKDDMPYYKTSRPDVDNLARWVLDSLQDFYVDDAQVVSLNAIKVYGEEDYIHVKMFHNKKYC